MRTRGITVAVSLVLLLGALLIGPTASSSGIRATVLPTLSTFFAMTVDDVHDQVFLSGGPGSSFLQVHDFSAAQTAVVSGQVGATDLELSGDSLSLYVALPGAHAISVIDTATLAEIHRYSLSASVCPEELALVGGYVVFSTRCATIHSFGWVNTADGSVRLDMLPSSLLSSYLLEAVIGSSNEVLAVPQGFPETTQMLKMRLDPQGLTVVNTAQVGSSVSDLSVIDASLFVVTRNSSTGTGNRFYRILALSDDGYLGLGGPMVGVSSTSDGLVTVGFLGSEPYHGDFAVFGSAADIPTRTHARRQFNFPEPSVPLAPLERPATRGVAWSPDGSRLFGVTTDQNGANPRLRVLTDPRKIDSATIVTSSSPPARIGGQISVDVLVSPTYFSPLPTGDVVVTRTDRLGTQTVATVPASQALGPPFTVTDVPRTTGRQRYTATYSGDVLYLPSSYWVDAFVYAVDGDLTGDLVADLAVGVPYEDYGSRRDTGVAAVLPGGPSGVTGAGGIGFAGTSDDYDRGGREAGDLFGYSTVLADFDANGLADLAVGVPYEDAELRDQGQVRIYWAADEGGGQIAYHDTLLSSQVDQRLGIALTSGDFHGNGGSELVLGARDERVRIPDLVNGPVKTLSQNSSGVPGTMRSGERHGTVFAVGDLNGDGYQDLAVGAPDDRDDRGYASGSVTVHYGSSSGLRAIGSQRWSLDSPGVSGSPAAGNASTGNLNDGFSSALASGDFNGDGFGDLAVGVPGSPVSFGGATKQDAGAVTILFGSASGLSATGSLRITEGSPGVPSDPANDDQFGIALASGDANNDRRSELAIGVARRQAVVVLAGVATGFGSTGIKSWSQNTTGIPDSTESGDGWGSDLRFGHFRSAAHADLVVSARGENGGAGAITLIYGSPTGLTAAGSMVITQGTAGVPDNPEPGDHFGYLD